MLVTVRPAGMEKALFVEVSVFGQAHYKNKGIIGVSRRDKP